MFCHVYLAQRQLVVVLVVQNIHQIRIERVDILNLRELTQNPGQLFAQIGLGELDFLDVK